MNPEKNPNPPGAPFVDIPVRFSDVDMYRIAWHGRYTAWLEEARNALASLAGFSLLSELDRGYRFPIVDLSIQYRRPALWGDLLRIRARYEPESIARITFHYEIQKLPAGDRLATATTRQVILRGDELLVTKPAELSRILLKLEEIQATGAGGGREST